MERPRSIVIVGAGMAGATAAVTVRELGFDGGVTLVGGEHHPPYDRPPLSKGYLRGSEPLDKVVLRPEDAYAERGIQLLLGRRAISIDRAGRTVTLDQGAPLAYDRLLLATGSTPRRPAFAGADLPGVRTLRTLDDADAIKAEAATAGPVVVVGSGWIGAEVAASLREVGRDVTLVTGGGIPMARHLGRAVAGVYAGLHRERGVVLVDGRVTEVRGAGRAESVVIDDGTVVPAGLVVLGLGATPNVELADTAGLSLALGGIAVDECLQSDDPAIFVAGDPAAAIHPVYRRRLRIEHRDNAKQQGKLVARNLLGERAPYTHVPYFYSDQFDLGMEYRGLASDVDDVVLAGDVPGRVFLAFWLEGDRVVAAMNANSWDQGERLAEMVRDQVTIDRAELARHGAAIPVG